VAPLGGRTLINLHKWLIFAQIPGSSDA
jgi:hypothetical protein